MCREGLKVCVHEDSKFPTLSHTSRLENRWVILNPRTSWKRLTWETPRITPSSCPDQVTSYNPHVLSRALSHLFQFPAPLVFFLVLSPNIILKWPQAFRKGDRKVQMPPVYPVSALLFICFLPHACIIVPPLPLYPSLSLDGSDASRSTFYIPTVFWAILGRSHMCTYILESIS